MDVHSLARAMNSLEQERGKIESQVDGLTAKFQMRADDKIAQERKMKVLSLETISTVLETLVWFLRELTNMTDENGNLPKIKPFRLRVAFKYARLLWKLVTRIIEKV